LLKGTTMALDPLTAVLDIGGKIIDKLFPDPAQRDAAKLELYKAERQGALADLQIQMSAIVAEAQSADPWTSRARPTFLYVVYLMILFSIPMGFVAAFRPELATSVATGMKAWLDAIPNELYTLFGVGYLGYTGARMWEKGKGAAK